MKSSYLKRINSFVSNTKSKKYFSSETNSTYIWGENKINDINKFKEISYQMIEDIISFNKNIDNTRVVPNVKPKFLKDILHINFSKPALLANIREEEQNKIFPNMTLWNHPRFLNWYPSMTSFPAILGNLVSNSFETSGDEYKFNAISNDLEIKIMKWMGKVFNLPEQLVDFDKKAGGYINFAAGEISIIAALAGKTYKSTSNPDKVNLFKYYYSSHSHYSVKKGINTAGADGTKIPVKWNENRGNYEMNIEILEKEIENDIKNGYLPAYVCATVGTTGTSGVDDVLKIGKLKEKYNFWFHVDAAYSGNVFMLEEYSYLLKGLEKANSVCINGNKWQPVSENSGYFYFSDRNVLSQLFTKNSSELNNIINFELFSKRVNKSIRLYTVMNTFGTKNYQEIVRRFLRAAKVFEKRLTESKKFKLVGPVEFALVCFTLENREQTMKYMDFINSEPVLSIGPYELPDALPGKEYILRISINYLYVTEEQAVKDCDYLISAYDRCFADKINITSH